MKAQLILAGTVAALPLLLPAHATILEQPVQIAQAQEQRQQRQEQRQQRQEQRQQQQEQRQQSQPQRPAAQERREQRRQSQPQRPDARPPRPAVQERRERRQERREPQRPAAQERREQQRPAVQERRQKRREDTRERRQDRREDAREQRQDRRQDTQRARRLDELRERRRETREGNRTVIREQDRTIIRDGNRTIIRHDEVDRFRRFGGRNVRVERRGNDTVTIIDRGRYRIVSVVGRDGRLLRRLRRYPDGREVVIIDNRPRGGAGFFLNLAPPVIRIPRERYIVEAAEAPPALLYDTLTAAPVEPSERAYALEEVRYNVNLRDRMPRVDLDGITFDFGSWEVMPDQAARLEPIAQGILRAIENNPDEVFLIEGHTDAVGDETDNLSLSDRRAEAVAIVLTERYQVPPENLVTQGYGEQYLKVDTQDAERRNRRVTLRRITPLLAGKAGGGSSPN